MALGLSGGYSSKKSTSQSQYSNTSTTTRNLTPFQSALQAPLFGYVNNALSNPTALVDPFRRAARSSVNSTYSGLADSLRQQFLSTGGGSSGKYGTATLQGNLARLGALSNVDTQFAQTAAQLPLQISNLATNLLGLNFGQTTTSSGQESGTGTESGWSVSAGVGNR